MSTPDKPQRAVTSASNAFRRDLCPGSAREEAKFSEVDSEYSTEGTLLHSYFMRGKVGEFCAEMLTGDQQEALNTANFHAQDFIRQFREDCGIPEDAEFVEQHEVPLMLNYGGEDIFPGHADYVITWPEYSAQAVIDAKFGFMEVEEAADNLQLASYAVMCPHMSFTGVAIVQPRNFGPKKSVAIYGAEAIQQAKHEIIRIFRESEKPDAPLNPSLKACHFCRAKSACPAYQAKFMQLSPSLSAAIETVDNEQIVRMLEAVKFADKIAKEVRDEMRKRIEAGTLPGWKLQNTGSTRKLIDGMGLFQAMTERFPMVHDFAIRYTRCLDVKWGLLEELFSHLTGVTEKQANEHVKAIAEPYVQLTEKAKSIVVDKPKKLK